MKMRAITQPQHSPFDVAAQRLEVCGGLIFFRKIGVRWRRNLKKISEMLKQGIVDFRLFKNSSTDIATSTKNQKDRYRYTLC